VPEYAPVNLPLSKTKPVQESAAPLNISRLNSSSAGGHRQKTIIVIMPVGIPGMGKSTFIETQLRPYLENLSDVKFVTFASDAIRKDILEETMARNKA
jgi:signal recognition particle GTPase